MKKIIFTEKDVNSIIFYYVNTPSSTRDIAKQFSCANNTINKVLKENCIELNSALKISQKMIGKKFRLGAKHSEESKSKMSAARKGKKPTTLGKIYTPEERKNISDGVKKAFLANPTKRSLDARLIGLEKIKKSRDRCKTLLRRVLKITGTKKITKTYEALGYTEKELINHITPLFTEGMCWTKRESFHIDHIKPVSAFMKEGIFDPKIINALSNLQPLTPAENRRKGDSFDPKYRQQTLRALFDERGRATYKEFL